MRLFKTALLLAAPLLAQAQSTVYSGNAQLGTQAAVNAFGSQYTKITGKLQIYGATVKNLAPLANIDTVLGKLEILTTDSLQSLDGLNVKYAGSNVYLESNKKLRSISALQTLKFIGGDLVVMNCDTLRSLNGLQNVDSVKGGLYIGVQGWSTPVVAKGNDSLDNLCALTHLITSNGLVGAYNVANNAWNPAKSDFALGKCGTPVFYGNVQLGTQGAIDSFGAQYTKVTGKLQVFGTTPKNLAPLSRIDTVLGKLEVLTTDSLASLDGLKVKYVGSNVYLDGNKSLRNITALQSLTYIGKDLVILDCDRLKSLDGLQNVDSIKGGLYIGTEAWKTPPGARGNDSLTDYCGLKHVLSTNGLTGTYNVANNSYDPGKADIVSGNCAKPVLAVAATVVPEAWSVYSAPSAFFIRPASGIAATGLRLLNAEGRIVYAEAHPAPQNGGYQIRHDNLPAGLYIIEVQDARGVQRMKAVK